MTKTTAVHDIAGSQCLYMSLELAWKEWKLSFTIGRSQKPRQRTIKARNLAALRGEILAAKKRFGLPESARVVSCYEAGRDGFWIHRYLTSKGIENVIVDASSIEVKRRGRRRKTDHIDGIKLVMMLVRYVEGELGVWGVVEVPSDAEEDARHVHRELEALKRDRVRQMNRIRGLLALHGLELPSWSDFEGEVARLKRWDGSRLPTCLHARLLNEYRRLVFVDSQIRDIEALRRRLVKESSAPAIDMVRLLNDLRGIGIQSSWLFTYELFAWRAYRNCRQAGSLVGLAPTPYNSGDSSKEQGISKAGSRRVRRMAIEIAWGWLRYQKKSRLTTWYQTRFGGGGSRLRRIGIVALARKLLIDLWRYAETGVVPEGAELKAR